MSLPNGYHFRPCTAADLHVVTNLYLAAFGKDRILDIMFPERHQYPEQVVAFLHRHFLKRMWTRGWLLIVVVDETLDVPVGLMWWLEPASEVSAWERWISPYAWLSALVRTYISLKTLLLRSSIDSQGIDMFGDAVHSLEPHFLNTPRRQVSWYLSILAVHPVYQGQRLGKFGAVWEVLLTMEWLLKHLEESKLQHERDEEPYLRIGCNLGWMKLDQYYTLTEDSPAYLAALVLHPAFRWSTVESQWADHPDWLDRGRAAVQELWGVYRALPVEQDAIPEQPTVARKTTDLDDFMTAVRKLTTHPAPSASIMRDEYAEWIATTDPGDCLVEDPIQYWLLRRRQYPRLSLMAIDLFSVPAMSSEPERIFSLTGQMVTAQRGRLKTDIIGAAQCISSWEKSGVIEISK